MGLSTNSVHSHVQVLRGAHCRKLDYSHSRIGEAVSAPLRNATFLMTFWRMEVEMTFANQYPSIAAQKAKFHTQREFIRLLERQREDVEIVQMEKDVLGSMVQTLNSASRHCSQL